MDLEKYSIEDLLLTAIKSEVESKKTYLKLSKKVKNGLLQDKLEFLANEEEKHKIFIEEIFKNNFPGREITLPEKTLVPLPEIQIADEDTPISELLRSAMQVEKAAQDFYLALSKRFKDTPNIENTLIYFGTMELGHYKLLEIEMENMQRFEEADFYWPMMHVGP